MYLWISASVFGDCTAKQPQGLEGLISRGNKSAYSLGTQHLDLTPGLQGGTTKQLAENYSN